jgi:uncharacterized protein
MNTWITAPWPWYVSGAAIGGIVWLMWFLGRSFGISSNFRTLCTLCGAGKAADFFDFDWKSQKWNLYFLVGAMAGGFMAAHWLSPDGGQVPALTEAAIADLAKHGFEAPSAFLPPELYGTEGGFPMEAKTLGLLFIGGLLVGFGSRYAGGCTSGHAITGLSTLQLPSFIAVIGFFIGGLVMTHLLLPLLL